MSKRGQKDFQIRGPGRPGQYITKVGETVSLKRMHVKPKKEDAGKKGALDKKRGGNRVLED